VLGTCNEAFCSNSSSMPTEHRASERASERACELASELA